MYICSWQSSSKYERKNQLGNSFCKSKILVINRAQDIILNIKISCTFKGKRPLNCTCFNSKRKSEFCVLNERNCCVQNGKPLLQYFKCLHIFERSEWYACGIPIPLTVQYLLYKDQCRSLFSVSMWYSLFNHRVLSI